MSKASAAETRAAEAERKLKLAESKIDLLKRIRNLKKAEAKETQSEYGLACPNSPKGKSVIERSQSQVYFTQSIFDSALLQDETKSLIQIPIHPARAKSHIAKTGE